MVLFGYFIIHEKNNFKTISLLLISPCSETASYDFAYTHVQIGENKFSMKPKRYSMKLLPQ